MHIRTTLAATALLCAFATAAGAQQGPLEIGFDGQIGFGLDDQGTVIAIPVQKVRVGFPLSPALSLEPALGLIRFSDDDNSATSFALDASLLYHFSTARTQNQAYVRPVIGINRTSFDTGLADDSNTAVNFGVALGLKIPLLDRLATRLEAEFRHQLENDPAPAQSALNLNFGLSFFTR